MSTRRLLPPSVRDTLLGIPSDTTSLERNYVLADEDLELIGTRRRIATLAAQMPAGTLLGWYHIGLTGDDNWRSGAAERMNARPLDLYAARIPA